jgi:uncharacterized protein (DUF302 family)
MTPDGLVSLASRFSPKEMADRFVAALETFGMTVFARIDHAAAAHAVGLELRATEVILFGNPRAGTLLMQEVQTIGIDLPLKALIWQDQAQTTWLSYNDPTYLAERHGAGASIRPALMAMSAALTKLADKATAGDHT